MGASPADDASALIRNLSIFTASVVSLSGVFQAWSSVRITQSLEEGKRTQAFSKQILDQMDNLTGDNETKGKIALVGLYIIAANDKDKMNIANIALQSGKTNLRDAAAFLLGQECRDHPEMETCSNALAMLARAADVTLQRQIHKEDSLIRATEGAPGSGSVENVQVQPSPVATALEEITTAKIAASDLQGWIYIGKADRSGSLGEDRTVNVRTKPAPDADVTTTTSVYLRSEGTIRSGTSLGIIPKGQVLKVYGIRSAPLADGSEALWAKVRTRKGSVQNPG